MTPGARARISLGAIQHNLNLIRSHSNGARVMAVVKGNAYGHGLVPVAKSLADVDSFAVARLSEARQLRDAGIETPIVLFGGVMASVDLAEAAHLAVSLCVHNENQIDWLDAYSGPSFDVWLKVDTGMNRLGFDTSGAVAAIQRLRACGSVNRLSVMTHFANADDPEDEMSRTQIERFEKVVADFGGEISIANSGGVFAFSNALQSFADAIGRDRIWVRPGIALYGVSPIDGRTGVQLGLIPAMQFETRLVSVRSLKAGDRVGYGGDWQADRDTQLGTIAVGYGDGYSRFIRAGTPVRLNGREAPVAGRISMDLTAIDLGEGATDKIGDPVLLWGDELPVEKVAEKAGTAAYQLVTGVMHREAPSYE